MSTWIGVLVAIFVPICAALAVIMSQRYRLQRHRAAVARARLRPPEDPLARAKDPLQRPGPPPSLFARTNSGISPAHEGPAHGRDLQPAARTR